MLATPVMIMVMENAALNAIKPYLDAGESALGTRVDVRHLAATPAGRHVTGEAKVTKVDGRRIEFSVRATDGNEEIGVGHTRTRGDTAVEVIRTDEGQILLAPPCAEVTILNPDSRRSSNGVRLRNRTLRLASRAISAPAPLGQRSDR